LQYVPVELPGWPEAALIRLQRVLPELEGREMAAALLGLADMLTLAAEATQQQQQTQDDVPFQTSSDSNSRSSVRSSPTGNSNTNNSSNTTVSSGRYQHMVLDIEAIKPQLLSAVEAASSNRLALFTLDDLAMLGNALLHLGHTPRPHWVAQWAAAAARLLPTAPPTRATGQGAVLLLAAAAGFQARPDQSWLQMVMLPIQRHAGELELAELVAVARALFILGFKVEADTVQLMAASAQAQLAHHPVVSLIERTAEGVSRTTSSSSSSSEDVHKSEGHTWGGIMSNAVASTACIGMSSSERQHLLVELQQLFRAVQGHH
jgi:hypothetical protein